MNLVGKKIVEKGYTSTSFCDFSNIGLMGRNGYITFNIPKGRSIV